MIKLLIFDLWGTIIENGIYSPIKQVKNILRIDIPFEEYVVRFEKVFMLNDYSDLYEGFKLVCKEFNIKENPYILNKLVGLWNKNWLLARPYNNALETVQTLKEDYKTALIVNADKSINSLIEKYSLEKYFDKIYLSYQTKFLKVNPESFKVILKDFKVKPEECMMIGDSIDSDMKTPNSLGMKTVLVDFKERREYPLKIKNIEELPQLLKEKINTKK